MKSANNKITKIRLHTLAALQRGCNPIRFGIKLSLVLLVIFVFTQGKLYAQCPAPNQSNSNSSACSSYVTFNVTNQGVSTSITSMTHYWYANSTGGTPLFSTTASQVASQVWSSAHSETLSSPKTYWV